MAARKTMRMKPEFALALLAIGGLAGCAASEGVAVNPGRLDGNSTLQTLSGVGLIAQKREEITYRPRSPLALPQQYELRQPEAADAAAQANPAWPRDPDAERRRREAAVEAMSLDEYRRQRGVSENSRDVLLSPEELARGTRPGAGQQTEPARDRRDSDVFLLPSQYNRTRTPEEVERQRVDSQGAEPPRRYLTEPPAGYRSPVQGTTPEGQRAAEEARRAREAAKPEQKGGWLSWLGL